MVKHRFSGRFCRSLTYEDILHVYEKNSRCPRYADSLLSPWGSRCCGDSRAAFTCGRAHQHRACAHAHLPSPEFNLRLRIHLLFLSSYKPGYWTVLSPNHQHVPASWQSRSLVAVP
ncbi:hypothetical protein M3J09_001596 [Ascochyta lentis]